MFKTCSKLVSYYFNFSLQLSVVGHRTKTHSIVVNTLLEPFRNANFNPGGWNRLKGLQGSAPRHAAHAIARNLLNGIGPRFGTSRTTPTPHGTNDRWHDLESNLACIGLTPRRRVEMPHVALCDSAGDQKEVELGVDDGIAGVATILASDERVPARFLSVDRSQCARQRIFFPPDDGDHHARAHVAVPHDGRIERSACGRRGATVREAPSFASEPMAPRQAMHDHSDAVRQLMI